MVSDPHGTARLEFGHLGRRAIEGRFDDGRSFLLGYYDSYCYLPLYVFCGEQMLAAAMT